VTSTLTEGALASSGCPSITGAMPNADDFREELYKPIFSIQGAVEF